MIRYLLILPTLIYASVVYDPTQFVMRGSHPICFKDEYVIKISRGTRQDNQELLREGAIIAYLNRAGCQSCPKLIDIGLSQDGRVYLKIERIPSSGQPTQKEILKAYIEQKHLGIFQNDPNPSNFCLREGKCILIDYGLAEMSSKYITMETEDFLKLFWEKIRD